MKQNFTLLGMLLCISISGQISLMKDSSFGDNGTAKFSYPAEMELTNFEKIFTNDDQSVIIALGSDGDYHTGMIAKLSSFGVLDTSYNGSGKIVLNGNLHTGIEFSEQDGKMIAVFANDATQAEPDTKIMRFNKNGALDTEFGLNGVVDARPDLFYRQLNFQPDGFYHLWGKITGYHANGTVNSQYGNNGNQDPVVNGIPQDYMELYSFFGNRNGRNFLNKYHYEIAVSSENMPHQFTSYDLTAHHFYDVAGSSNGISVYPKKFHLTPNKEIVYLFGIDPNSGNERNRAVILNEMMQPKSFSSKEYIDLGEVSTAAELKDIATFQNQYLFVGKKGNKPVILAYDSSGNKSEINGKEEFYDNSNADDYTSIIIKGNTVYVMGKRSATREVFLTKYTAKTVSASENDLKKSYITSPFKDEIKFMGSHQPKNITVYDISGRSVATARKNTVTASHLPKGSYIIQVDFADKPSEIFKSIKN